MRYFGIALAVAGLIWCQTASAQEGLADAAAEDVRLSSQGDAERGRKVFFRCQSCHELDPGAAARLGPNLHGLFGRMAGEAEGYSNYSRALREADFIWTEERLDQWLTDPRGFLPGNKMAFQGIRSASQRLDLLAYLRSLESE